MEEDMKSLVKVSLWVTSSLTYTYFLTSRIPPGKTRLISILPVLYLLLHLPMSFASINLRGISSFFLCWLAVFKLLLFSFGHGPLSPSLPLLTFISIASFPVKLKPPTNQNPLPLPSLPPKSPLITTPIKALLFALITPFYAHKHRLHPYLLPVLYCVVIYLVLDLVLASAAAIARAHVGLQLEPQVNEPYRATSLQDFWGRRWNLMVSAILRPTVYSPVRDRWGPLAGVMAAFLVSGLMHELMFYYITLAGPAGEVLCFFLLHGLCTVAEVKVKRAVAGRWRLHPVVSVVLAVGFIAVTGLWLFFPALVRNGTDERAMEEFSAVMGFLVDRFGGLCSRLLTVLRVLPGTQTAPRT